MHKAVRISFDKDPELSVETCRSRRYILPNTVDDVSLAVIMMQYNGRGEAARSRVLVP
jgi:hypothetical protein